MTVKQHSHMNSPEETLQIAAVFPGDAKDGTEVCGTSESVRQEVKQHGWRVLAA